MDDECGMAEVVTKNVWRGLLEHGIKSKDYPLLTEVFVTTQPAVIETHFLCLSFGKGEIQVFAQAVSNPPTVASPHGVVTLATRAGAASDVALCTSTQRIVRRLLLRREVSGLESASFDWITFAFFHFEDAGYDNMFAARKLGERFSLTCSTRVVPKAAPKAKTVAVRMPFGVSFDPRDAAPVPEDDPMDDEADLKAAIAAEEAGAMADCIPSEEEEAEVEEEDEIHRDEPVPDPDLLFKLGVKQVEIAPSNRRFCFICGKNILHHTWTVNYQVRISSTPRDLKRVHTACVAAQRPRGDWIYALCRV